MDWLLLSGLALATGGMLLARQWLWLVVALLVVYMCVAGFLFQQPLATDLALGITRWILPLAEVVSGVVVVGILLVTGLTFGRDERPEQLDEVSLMELRRVARRSFRLAQPAEWSDYLLPVAGFVIALVATTLLPHIYRLTGAAGGSLDAQYSWTLLVLAGMIQLIIAQDMLKLGGGILLIGLGLQLFYLDGSTSIGLPVLALLHIAMIVLALVVAYLCGLLYGRLQTLDLDELYSQREGLVSRQPGGTLR
ncbi:MAG: hypothetical protein H0X37_06725 [Herpetosiphonaceae bacterium]|nr:hypothetical protein [Herpetosiphonaceae bacterium]